MSGGALQRESDADGMTGAIVGTYSLTGESENGMYVLIFFGPGNEYEKFKYEKHTISLIFKIAFV